MATNNRGQPWLVKFEPQLTELSMAHSKLMLWLSIQLRVTFCRITAVVKSNEVEISAVLALFNAEISSLFDFNENWHEHFPN